MKSNSKNSTKIVLLCLLVTLASCGNQRLHTHTDVGYTCPMHPRIDQDAPGSCPICGMELVLKGGAGNEVKITHELSTLLKPTDASIVSSIRTVTPERRTMPLTTEVKGTLTYDTRRATTLPIRFSGRIERLYINYNYQPIRQGQRVLEIYSPELLTAQRELLYLLESDPTNESLITGAKKRLTLLGLSTQQVSSLIETRKETYSFSVYSPFDGYIVEEQALQPGNTPASTAAEGSEMGNGMNTSASTLSQQNQPARTEIRIRAGTYVTAGETVFRIINSDQVWASFELYPKDGARLKMNDPLSISFENSSNKTVNAKVNFIQPILRDGANFINLRSYLNNPGGAYSPGQLVTARFERASNTGLWVPLAAVLDLGDDQVVFVKRRGSFRPTSVNVGPRSSDWVEIVAGVESADSIASQAQYLVDSESFIKVSKRN